MTRGQKAYGKFLKTEFWKELSARKKKRCKKCSRCGSTKRLQAHHIRYRDDWYDTKLRDLKVLCYVCHKIEHFGERYFLPHGRPWQEEYAIDLISRLMRRISKGWLLGHRQVAILNKLKDMHPPTPTDSCISFKLGLVFELNSKMIGYKSL
jgi:hypothetical protein